ncbi:MAG: hypothetical protein ACOC1O_02815 [bacterium]
MGVKKAEEKINQIKDKMEGYKEKIKKLEQEYNKIDNEIINTKMKEEDSPDITELEQERVNIGNDIGDYKKMIDRLERELEDAEQELEDAKQYNHKQKYNRLTYNRAEINKKIEDKINEVGELLQELKEIHQEQRATANKLGEEFGHTAKLLKSRRWSAIVKDYILGNLDIPDMPQPTRKQIESINKADSFVHTL